MCSNFHGNVKQTIHEKILYQLFVPVNLCSDQRIHEILFSEYFFFFLVSPFILNPFHRLYSHWLEWKRRKHFFLCQEFSIDKIVVCHQESQFQSILWKFYGRFVYTLMGKKKMRGIYWTKRKWLKSHVDGGLFLGAIKRFHEVKNRNLTSLQMIIPINEWHSPSHFVFHSATPTQ